jgi:hypothetical protein
MLGVSRGYKNGVQAAAQKYQQQTDELLDRFYVTRLASLEDVEEAVR